MNSSVAFLHRFHPNRLWVLTAIEPDGGGIETRTFQPAQADEARGWIDENNGKSNLYFSVAEPRKPTSRKLSITDVGAVYWLHVDIDPRPGKDLIAERERIRDLLSGSLPSEVPDPSCIIDSGGGYQAFWRLAEPIVVDGSPNVAKEVASLNIWLERQLGADACHNIDRIMRLPYTCNLPNAKKRERGRVPVDAELYDAIWDRVYSPGDFGRMDSVTPSGETGSVRTDVIPIESVDHLDLPDWVRVLIVNGRDPDDPYKYPSRSEALFAVVCAMVRADIEDGVILGVLLDDGFGISESVREKPSPERYARKQIASARDQTATPELDELNTRFAVIANLGGRCRVVEEVHNEALGRDVLAKYTFEDFRNRFLNRKIEVPAGTDKDGNPRVKLESIGKWWLEHPARRQYDRLVFLPGRDVPDAYNLWRGFAVRPEPGERHERYLDHIRVNVCHSDARLFDYVVNWMASVVQHPDCRLGTAIILRGRQGTGKGVAARGFGYLVGRHFFHVTSAKHVVGNFNSHLRDVLVLFADECFVPGRREDAAALKTLITEPTLTIEAKGVDAEPSPNFINLIMASNEDWVADIESDDRRLCVLDIGDDHQQDQAYFGAIVRDLVAGGYANLLRFLMDRDLSGFNAERDLPNTLAKDDQKNLRALRDPWTRVQFNWLHDGGPLPDSSFVSDGGGLFVSTTELAGILDVSPIRAGRFLKIIGGSTFRPRMDDGSRPIGYLLGRDLTEHRARWVAAHRDRIAIRWPEDATWQIDWPTDDEVPF